MDRYIAVVGCNRLVSGVISLDLWSRHNSLQSNDTDQDLEKLDTHTAKKAAWHSRQQHARNPLRSYLQDVGVQRTGAAAWLLTGYGCIFDPTILEQL